MSVLAENIGEIEGRVFVDSAPVMERTWAQKSGAGWIGKNSLLLNKDRGSFFFLAELISDLELVEDGPVPDHCGTCTRDYRIPTFRAHPKPTGGVPWTTSTSTASPTRRWGAT